VVLKRCCAPCTTLILPYADDADDDEHLAQNTVCWITTQTLCVHGQQLLTNKRHSTVGSSTTKQVDSANNKSVLCSSGGVSFLRVGKTSGRGIRQVECDNDGHNDHDGYNHDSHYYATTTTTKDVTW